LSGRFRQLFLPNESAENFKKPFPLYGLGKIFVHARIEAPFLSPPLRGAVLAITGTRGISLSFSTHPDSPDRLHAVHFGHLDIEQHGIVAGFFQGFQGLPSTPAVSADTPAPRSMAVITRRLTGICPPPQESAGF
jgi:hypothetical protein